MRRLVAGLTGGKSLPAVVLDPIVAKADGVPLFVEELTKAVLELGLLREEDDRYELDGPLPPLAIPATLQDSLMARLDRLAPVKEVAQVAAVIGREFSYELLAAVTAGRRESSLKLCGSWSRQSWSSAAARPRMPPTSSSTRWSGTRPTPACSRASASNSIRG